MFRKQRDMSIEVVESFRGGKGTVNFVHIFNPEEMTGSVRRCVLIRLAPGNSIGYHLHQGEEEIYYIVKGSAKVNVNGDVQLLGPGDGVLTGGGRGHSIENVGEDTLEVVSVIIFTD